jgi:uncharacterized cupin superfamily protein
MTHPLFRIDPDPDAKFQPSHLQGPETFTTQDTVELDYGHFVASDETVFAGVWQCAPCRERIAAFPVNEMMTIISGRLTLTHADGRAEDFGPGDVLFIPKGTTCVWEITETLRKYYMISK